MTPPIITTRPSFFALGVVRRCDSPETTDFEGIWHEFLRHEAEIKPHSIELVWYGIGFPVAGGGGFDYLAGMAVEGVAEVPEGLQLREVPEATEAVFACTMATIGETYAFAYHEWLPASEYVCGEPLPWIEKYMPTAGEGSELRIEIHIPLRKKGL